MLNTVSKMDSQKLGQRNISYTDIDKGDDLTLKEIILKIKDFSLHILSKWYLILSFVVFGGLLGYFYPLLNEKLYKAELTFVLEENGSKGLGLSDLAGQIGLGTSTENNAFSGDNLLALLKSQSLIKKTLLKKIEYKGEKISLARFFLKINIDKEGMDLALKKYGSKDVNNINDVSVVQNQVLNEIYSILLTKYLMVDKLDKKTSIMLIKVTSLNDVFAKEFAESLAEEASSFYIATKTKKTAKSVSVLQYQVDSVKRQLNYAIGGMASSIDMNPNANPARQVLKVPTQRRQVDVESNRAILTELVKNLELLKITLRKETPLIQVIDTPTYPLPIEALNRLKLAVVGGLLFGFLGVLFIVLKRVFKSIML